MDLLNVTPTDVALLATMAKCMRDLLDATSLTLDIKDDKVAERYTLARMNAREVLREAKF